MQTNKSVKNTSFSDITSNIYYALHNKMNYTPKEEKYLVCIRSINLVLNMSNFDILRSLIKRTTMIRSRKKINIIYEATKIQRHTFGATVVIIANVLNFGIYSVNIDYNRSTHAKYRIESVIETSVGCKCSKKGTRSRPEMKENYISRKLICQCQDVKESPSGY